MQKFSWYIRRARSMSPGELAWRAQSAIRDAADRIRIPLGWLPQGGSAADGLPHAASIRLTDVGTGEWLHAPPRETAWRAALVGRAERALTHRMSFFDLEDRDFGHPIRWNYDYDRGVATPMGLSSSIDYRDYGVTGDCKVVWEPSRHHQLVVLARAYRATGEVRFAREVVDQIDSWIAQCPFGRGMQWRSPLELAIRLINWVWAYDLIRDSGAGTDEFRSRFLRTAYLHLWDVARKFSRGSSANNHLIGEAAGVFIGSVYFADLPEATAWRQASAAILEREIVAQTYGDGGGREQAFGYHGFVIQFLIAAAVAGRKAGADFSAAYWTRLERMLEFACGMLEGGPAPRFGDADDGYVLDLGAGPGDMRDLLAVGAALFGRADFKRVSIGHDEPVRWILGRNGIDRYDQLETGDTSVPLAPRAFPSTGYHLLQCGHITEPDAISVLFDCGELGFGPIAAHGHADALSVTVRAFGRDLLVDPGTYDYFTHPTWRSYFRSTSAHNTVAIDGADQSEMLGLFLWGQRANTRCTAWDPVAGQPTVAGEHDGYRRLPDPVVHARRVVLDVASRVVTITDEIRSAAEHRIVMYWHFADGCRVKRVGPHTVGVFVGDNRATFVLDSSLTVAALSGATNPPGGWVSPGYHRKSPSTTLAASCTIKGGAQFVCRLVVDAPA